MVDMDTDMDMGSSFIWGQVMCASGLFSFLIDSAQGQSIAMVAFMISN